MKLFSKYVIVKPRGLSIRRFSVLMMIVSCICLAVSGNAEAVSIKGKTLGEIGDIVKQATGSEFGELQKQSLMFVERYPDNSNNSSLRPRIFTFNADGTLDKTYAPEQWIMTNVGKMQAINEEYRVKNIHPAMSSKRFETRRTVAYFVGGNDNQTAITPAQVFSFANDNNNVDITAKELSSRGQIGYNAYVRYGSDSMTLHGYGNDKDVFVSLHSAPLATKMSLYVDFFATDRNESGDVSLNIIKSASRELFSLSNGLRAAGIVAADLDGDGYKNEFAVCYTDNNRVYIFFYTAKLENNELKIYLLKDFMIHDGGYHYSHEMHVQGTVSMMAGDFDGDGKQEIATVTRVFPQRRSGNRLRINVYKYDPKTKNWKTNDGEFTGYGSTDNGPRTLGTCKATRFDSDGDGKDELALLFTEEYGGTYYPKLTLWTVDPSTLKPSFTGKFRGGVERPNEVLGATFKGNYLDNYYYFTEVWSITAGSFTGKAGKAKLADDLAISWTDDRSRVYIIPTQLDNNKNFSAFGETKKIYDEPVTATYAGYARGAVLAGDFADESLYLGKPTKQRDTFDPSFVTILQASPYHIDNLNAEGTDIEKGSIGIIRNYTFSGFNGDEGNGKMSVSYVSSASSAASNHADFVMSSSTETISVLGEAGKYVHGYLKFNVAAANIVGNFDPRVKKIAGAANQVMDLITDKIDETTTKANESSSKVTVTDTTIAYDRDFVSMYSAERYIWRYPILNDPLPKWFVLGNRTDDNEDIDVTGENQTRYLTFTMYDSPTPSKMDSVSNSFYQPRHEEGNFFSYPTKVEASEGYNDAGKLYPTATELAWSKSFEDKKQIRFTNANSTMQKYEKKVEKSFLTKTISAIATAFGADDPSGLPPWSSHTQTFVKTYDQSEQIEIDLQARSTLDENAAKHKLYWMPYVAREGTLVVTNAVQLDTEATLWKNTGDPEKLSVYWRKPDPALPLPGRFVRNGANFKAETRNNDKATKMRGMRFYVPALGIYSDAKLLGGLTYQISVPIYNASFLDTGNFDVTLYYVRQGEWNVDKPNVNVMTEIDTYSLSLGGWKNETSGNNQGWAVFNWDIPADIKTGNYSFYVQIDPKNAVNEIHESRFNANANYAIDDVGGNNEGYFPFTVMSQNDAETLVKNRKNATVSAVSAKSSGPVVYRALFNQPSVSANAVRPAYYIWDLDNKIEVKATFALPIGIDGDIVQTEDMNDVYQYLKKQSEDAEVPITCILEYNGDRVYPEVLFYGFNWTQEALDSVNNKNWNDLKLSQVDSAFVVEEISLIPNQGTFFTFTVRPNQITNLNGDPGKGGAGFDILIPELSEVSYIIEDDSEDVEYDVYERWGDEIELVEDEYDDDDDDGVRSIGSPSGGCNVGLGAIMLLGLAGILTKRR